MFELHFSYLAGFTYKKVVFQVSGMPHDFPVSDLITYLYKAIFVTDQQCLLDSFRHNSLTRRDANSNQKIVKLSSYKIFKGTSKIHSQVHQSLWKSKFVFSISLATPYELNFYYSSEIFTHP